ncbi:hypothetical protein ATI61_103575 [Archangium gephyra]|uniref:Uncharacterized protein n=1 Tax=Archangium gephyra TaxID=48 RepID=A0ABX9K7S0_9BACT|nr:hypothetical protein ATI61_103575 [Archangium gephyra]
MSPKLEGTPGDRRDWWELPRGCEVPDFTRDSEPVASGMVELVLGAALLFARHLSTHVGWVVAAFFVAVFPGSTSA